MRGEGRQGIRRRVVLKSIAVTAIVLEEEGLGKGEGRRGYRIRGIRKLQLTKKMIPKV